MFDAAQLIQTIAAAMQPVVPVRPFPATTAAMAAFTDADLAMRTNLALPADEQGNYALLRRTLNATRRAVEVCYRDELLPAILGGRWSESPKPAKIPDTGFHQREPIAKQYSMIFEHSLEYRQPQGRKFAVAIIGRPFNLFDNGMLTKAARMSAVGFVAEMKEGGKWAGPDVNPWGVWARQDMSCWSTRDSSLVIAARGLRPEDASEFGFTPLAPCGH